jgi:hypothetical protein
MKFILALTLCSSLTGLCNTTMIHPDKFDTWSECVIGGAKEIIRVTEKYEVKFNEQKLVLSYFCNENHTDKTPT